MEFLDKLIIPQPDYNLVLLNYFLMLGLSIFFIYTGTLYGSMILSVYFKRRSKGNNHYTFLAKDYADIATDKKSYGYGLGIVSLLSVIFIYAQLLHKVEVGIVSYLIYSLVFYIIGLTSFFNYKSSLHLSNIFGNIKDQVSGKIPEATVADIDEIKENANNSRNSAGFWGILMMSFAMWLFVGAITLTANKAGWKSSDIITVLFSFATTVNLIQFLVVSIALASISFVFRKYDWDLDKNHDTEQYSVFAKRLNLWISMVMVLIIPLFFMFGIFSTSRNSLSTMYFVTSLFGIAALFVVIHQIYGVLKNNNIRLIRYAFFIFLFATSLLAVKEKIAFGVANNSHLLVMNEEYLKHKEEMMASMGLNEVKIDGADIYNRCMACHRPEDSPTAPAHKNIIAKYLAQSDPKAALVRFISNPVKVNPKWPNMPNQGLSPAEVSAVADYMLEKYGGIKKDAAPKDAAPKH